MLSLARPEYPGADPALYGAMDTDGFDVPAVRDDAKRGGCGNRDFDDLIAHAGLLMDRSLPIGMAAILGEPHGHLARQVREQICRSGECIAWANSEPLLAVVFRRGLVVELAPVLADILGRYGDLRVGVALADHLATPGELWAAARYALDSAINLRQGLVILGQYR